MALTVKSKSLTVPPGGENEGDVYIPGTGSTGPWNGHDDDFAHYTGGGYSYETPKDGVKARILDEDKFYDFQAGTGWVWDPDATGDAPEQVVFGLDGGGSALTAGVVGWAPIPSSCAITGWELTADVSGDLVVDLWVCAFAAFPPTVADTITAAAKPTLSGVQTASDSTLAGWSKALPAGSYIMLNIVSAATIQKAVLKLSTE